MIARSVTVDQLSADPHGLHRRLRDESPVAWLPALEAWLVTGHELAAKVMLDAGTFTVDDPRFSTQQVIGPSMLSLDGGEHRRHREPFAPGFRAVRVGELEQSIAERAADLVDRVRPAGSGDLRAAVAAPLAVAVMAEVLDLGEVDASELLGWYNEIVDAVHVVTSGGKVPESGHLAFDQLGSAVVAGSDRSALLASIGADGRLNAGEILSNVAVLLFGGVVTTESSISIALRYLLEDSALHVKLEVDRRLVRPFVEETLRLEPSAAVVDRYATRDVAIGGAHVKEGDLVRVSLSAANRDPVVFLRPDDLDLGRPNAGASLTFARGPHACLGVHLARLEVAGAVRAVLDGLPDLAASSLDPVEGLVFRAPAAVRAVWPGSRGAGG